MSETVIALNAPTIELWLAVIVAELFCIILVLVRR